MEWHNLRTLATEAWREVSTWAGVAALTGALALAFDAVELAEWNSRLAGASALVGTALILIRRAKGQE